MLRRIFASKWFYRAFIGGLVLVAATTAAVAAVLFSYSQDLPNHTVVADYQPKITTRIYAGDGQLLDEFADESRIFIPIEFVPDHVRNAFLAAEDQFFYSHFGVNPLAILRASIDNVGHYLNNRRLVGASTITQQVAKEFLLGGSRSERSIGRKIREAMLALRIENILSKNTILELYLNQIYLGLRSYGIASASLHYFDKAVTDLTVAEAAYLAALPKGPSNYHPLRRHDAAVDRRNWVIRRMLDSGFITDEQAEVAFAEELIPDVQRKKVVTARAHYFVEEVRRELIDRFGRNKVYESGLLVRTSIDPNLQAIAEQALRGGLLEYDRRHGYGGAITNFDTERALPKEQWYDTLTTMQLPAGTPDGWELAVVVGLNRNHAVLETSAQTVGIIALDDLKWARGRIAEVERERTSEDVLGDLGIVDRRETTQFRSQLLGPEITSPAQVLNVGDVILVAIKSNHGESDQPKSIPIAVGSGGARIVYETTASFTLEQVPEIDGGVVALDPHTGRVKAMTGGWSFFRSQFNRATQASRQPGSSFKPFVYIAALEEGLSPATRILDAPIVLDGWKPGNYGQRYYGPSLMRVGIERSRNLMTIRLSETVGLSKVSEVAERFGVVDKFELNPSGALGTQETTLLRMVAAYGQIANGGKEVTPTLIDRIQTANGSTIFRHDDRQCQGCRDRVVDGNYVLPVIPDTRAQLADPDVAFQISYMLQGVVDRGTGARIRRTVTQPLAGKTGTTDDTLDTWFIGYSPDLVVGVYIGFDSPRSLGMYTKWRQESASTVTVPVFASFMGEALKFLPSHPFRSPPSIRFVRIDTETGGLSRFGVTQKEFPEAFRAGQAPVSASPSRLITGTTSEEHVAPEAEALPEGTEIIQDVQTGTDSENEELIDQAPGGIF